MGSQKNNTKKAAKKTNRSQPQVRKLLLINRVFPPTAGATGRVLLELASALSGEGYDVTVLTTGPKTNIKREMYGVEIIRVASPKNPRSFFSNFLISCRLFFKALRLPRPDVIITKTDPPLFVIFGTLLSYLKWTKHVHWCQDLYPDLLNVIDYKTSSLFYKIIDALSSWALRSCTKVVTIGACMKHALLKKGLKSKQVDIIPNWYNGAINHKSQERVKESDLPPKFRVLYAGHMGKAHPYQTIMDAAALLSETETDIEFLFVGNAPQMQKLAVERGRKGLDNIRFLPYQPRRKLRTLLESGDVHIISMADEALGMLLPSRIYDVFTIQRPCLFIGPEACDISIILEKYEAGITIPQDKPEYLANAIRHLRDHGEDWHTLYYGAGEAAKAFTPEQSFELWKKLLKEL